MGFKNVLSLLNSAGFPADDKPFRFKANGIAEEDRFVAWLDIMGAGASMNRSLPESAAKIGKFNASILTAIKLLEDPQQVTVHTMTDGAYLVAKGADSLREVLSLSMVNIIRTFLSASMRNRFVVRCAVAYGKVVTSSTMDERLRDSEALASVDKAVLRNIMLGGPFATAYGLEGCAPPFGVFVDGTAIKAGFSDHNIWTWWVRDGVSPDAFISEFKKAVDQHFAQIEEHYYDHMLSACKIAEYRAKAKSYFRNKNAEEYESVVGEDSLVDETESDDSSEG